MHIIHHAKFHTFHWTELRELYASLTLQAFAIALIKFFLPLYLLSLGFSFTQMSLIFAGWGLAMYFMHKRAINLAIKIGVKHTLSISYLVLIAAFVLFSLAKLDTLYLIPGFLLYAAADVLYWDSRHLESSQIMPEKTSGKNIGVIMALILLATATAPAIGGLVGDRFGVNASLILAAGLVVVAIIPLSFTKDIVIKTTGKLSRRITTPKNYLVANASMNFDMLVANCIWPVFLFYLLGSLSAIGIIVSTALLTTVLLTYFMGRLSDKGYTKPLLKYGAITRALMHGARVVVTGLAGAVAVNVASDLAASLRSAPYVKSFYENARRQGPASFFYDVERAASLTITAAWALAATLSLLIGDMNTLLVFFVLALVVSPLQVLMFKKTSP